LIGVSGALQATGTGVGSGVGEGVGVALLIGSPRTVTISKRRVPAVPYVLDGFEATYPLPPAANAATTRNTTFGLSFSAGML